MIVSTPLLGSIICYCFSILLHFPCAGGFQTATLSAISISSSSSSSSALQAFKWPTIPTFNEQKNTIGERNGLDSDYPWRFEGRFIFRPSLVKVSNNNSPPSASLLSLFGYSLGGSVVLEYDISPVGPYREYVTMGGVVGLGNVNVGNDDIGSQKRTLGIGQWGTQLFVSTQVAEDVCQLVWGVPAQVADIDFIESGDTLIDGPDDIKGNRKLFKLSGWEKNARIIKNGVDPKRFGNIPIYWTPTIKALWAPLLFPGGGNEKEELLPLHRLRLSFSAISLKRCKRIIDESTNQQEGEIPLGLALVVDNVLIEIGERITSG